MNAVDGILAGLQIYELAIIPMLLKMRHCGRIWMRRRLRDLDSILQYSKLEEFRGEGCSDVKDFLKNLSMAESRMNFRLRSKCYVPMLYELSK